MVALDHLEGWMPRIMSGRTEQVVTIDKRLLPKYGPLWNCPEILWNGPKVRFGNYCAGNCVEAVVCSSGVRHDEEVVQLLCFRGSGCAG